MATPWEELIGTVEDGRINVAVREFTLDQMQQVHELERGGGGETMVVPGNETRV